MYDLRVRRACPGNTSPRVSVSIWAMTRAYTYGLLPPTQGADLVATQMRLGHAYRNRLVEIERARRAQVSEILERGEPAELRTRLATLVTAHDEARAEILRSRAATRRRRGDPGQAALRDRARDLAAQIRPLRAALRAHRAHPSESAQIGIAWVQLIAYHLVREARKASGLYWGTYLLHEQAMRAAATAASPPEPIPWRGEGRVSVQIQGGMSPDDLEDGTKIQILPGRHLSAPAGTQSHAIPLAGNGDQVGLGARSARVLRIRVGSGPGQRPIWAEWPMHVHRPLPDGCPIKVATVSLRRRGTRWDWSVQIVVDDGDGRDGGAARGGAVALNLGYAIRPGDQIRAGYVAGSDGMRREILVPARVIGALDKADAIRAQRDRDLNAARAQLAAWIAGQDEASLPDWFRERTQHVGSWRSPGRLAALARDWQRGWWDDGDAGYDLLERWRLRDLHLERYETGMRSTALRRRRDGYRVLARELADRYQTLIIDDTDLRDLQEIPAPESDDDPAWPAARRQRTVASPHELRAAFMNAFGVDRVVRRSAVYVTRDHVDCGHRNEPCRDSREVTCGGCGAVYDQDDNACQNLLREPPRATGDGQTARAPTRTTRRGYRIRKGSLATRSGE